MFERFFPDEYLDSAYVVNYKKLYQEGYRGLLFDVDNTLVPHGAPADERAIQLFKELRDIGFSCCLVSNNKKKELHPLPVLWVPNILNWHPSHPEEAMREPWSGLEQTPGIRYSSETSYLRTFGGLRMPVFATFW